MAKDSPRTTAGELKKIVESQGQKTLKKCQTAPTSPHVVWEGFKKKSPRSSKNKLQHIQLSDTTGTSNWTGFYGQMKQKHEVFSRLAAIDGDDGYTSVKPQHCYITCPLWHSPTPSFRFYFFIVIQTNLFS